MSDVSVGIETKLNDAGTKGLERDLGAAKAMADTLKKSTEEVTKASEEAGKAVQQQSDAHDEAAVSTRNLQGAGQQLQSALNGNISAITKSVAVSKELAVALQGAFSVIGAATFGWQIGKQLYDGVVGPALEAQMKVTGLDGAIAKLATTADKEAFAGFLETVDKITAAYKAQQEALSASEASVKNAFEWAKKLLDVNHQLEELRVKALPDGPAKDRAMAEVKAAKGEDLIAMQIEEARAQMAQSGQRVIAANDALSAARRARDEQLARARGDLAATDRQMKAKENAALADTDIGTGLAAVFTGGPDFRNANDYIALSQRSSELQRQIAELERSDQLKAMEEAAKKAEEKFWQDRQTSNFTEQLGGKQRQVVTQERSVEMTRIAREEQDARDKAAREAREASAKEEQRRLEEDRRSTEKKIDLAGKRGLPEQVRAQREAGEAQSAENIFRADGSIANRRNYERELAEAKEAQRQADQTVAALNQHLRTVTDRLKMIEQQIKNLPVQ